VFLCSRVSYYESARQLAAPQAQEHWWDTEDGDGEEGGPFAWELSAAAMGNQRSKGHRGDAGWEGWLAKLKKYTRKHGDCNVPQRWAEDPGLGRWVIRQRTAKKVLDRGDPNPRITAARVAKLDKLGFTWGLPRSGGDGTTDTGPWEGWLTQLKVYKRKHGNCNVPRGWAEDPGLGRWVGLVRRYKRALDRGKPVVGMTAARVAKLDALGFAWQLSASAISDAHRDDSGWEAQLAKLKQYKRRHGDCSVPRGWAEDEQLATWVANQRKCKRKLHHGDRSEGITAARVARLDKLGFAWSMSAVQL
jgi:hypothetical protein